MTNAFLFPRQVALETGMGKAFYASILEAKMRLDEASDFLKFDLKKDV